MPYTIFNQAVIPVSATIDQRDEILMDAGDLASDQDQGTFILDGHGKPVFAIVPVEFAERALTQERLL
jgi:hypothetical protein